MKDKRKGEGQRFREKGLKELQEQMERYYPHNPHVANTIDEVAKKLKEEGPSCRGRAEVRRLGPHRTGAMQVSGYELPRTLLLGASMNSDEHSLRPA
jgi:hypothetical protein